MNGKRQRRALLLGWLAALPGIVLGGDLICGRRLCNRCGIPCYRYPMEPFSDPLDATSLRAVAGTATRVNVTAGGITGNSDHTDLSLKTFQINERFLRIDHCEVSLVTVTVANEGQWFLTFVARQDPAIVESKLRPEFERFKRNQFRVEVNPVLMMSVQQSATNAALGKPELPHIPVQEFWVEKGQTIRIQRNERNKDLARYFDLIEQVDVHFSYR